MKYLLYFLPIFIVISSCKKDETSDVEIEENNFNRNIMFEQIGNQIASNLDTFSLEVDKLKTEIGLLESNLTTNQLSSTQIQWTTTTNAWKKCEMINFGDIENSFVFDAIDWWPANFTKIENSINEATEINESYVGSLGFHSRGLHTLEYLIFNEKGNQAVIDSLTITKRMQFATHIIGDIKTSSNKLKTSWDNYQPKFVESTGNSTTSSLGKLINEQISLLETISGTKLAIPMGKKFSTSKVDVTLVESYLSRESLSHIKSNIKGLRETFSGGDGQGIDDYLISFGADGLSNDITKQFDDVDLKIKAIDDNLSNAISSETAKVEALHTSIQQLLRLQRVDLANRLGIAVTFNDNDGDS